MQQCSHVDREMTLILCTLQGWGTGSSIPGSLCADSLPLLSTPFVTEDLTLCGSMFPSMVLKGKGLEPPPEPQSVLTDGQPRRASFQGAWASAGWLLPKGQPPCPPRAGWSR